MRLHVHLRYCFALFLASGLAMPASADEIRGRVVSAKGTPIGHARVLDVHAERAVSTDERGEFLLDCSEPCLLLVRHPRFTELAHEIGTSAGENADSTLELVLQAKQEIFEEIQVTADRGIGDVLAPVSIASTVVEPEDKPMLPSTLTELVEGAPAVAENGQGGLFQVFSVRGVSRYRVLTLVDGMQITHERRAGVATSFMDPLLMGVVDILRGPASTYYGSGALGGVVQIFPRRFEGLSVATGWESYGDETYQMVGWGDGTWSVGVARRDSSDDEIADGTLQNNHFTQYSASVVRTWESGDKTYETTFIAGLGRDIGKPNSDFPDNRLTLYPQETHALLRFSVTDDSGWSFNAWAHPNNLITETLRFGRSFTELRNEAFDLGAGWVRPFRAGKIDGRVGIDYFGRRSVLARERVESFSNGETTEAATLNGAEHDDVAAYASARWGWGAATLQAGARATWLQQKNAGQPTRDDSAVTGFLGATVPLGGGVELVANAGTGFRFPQLSERFFTGTTPRGDIIGNPDLDPERSLNLDLGLRWYGKRLFISGQIFRMEVDDYIERFEIADDILVFDNLLSGTIDGFELEGFYDLSERWQLNWSGQILDGDADDGSSLADIPADRVELGLRYTDGPWGARLRYQLRAEHDEPGSGEVAIPSAQVVSAAVSYQLPKGLRIEVRGDNLLDEEFFNSTDDKAILSPGRAVGIGLTWAQ